MQVLEKYPKAQAHRESIQPAMFVRFISKKAPQYLSTTKRYLEKGFMELNKAIQTRCRSLLEVNKKIWMIQKSQEEPLFSTLPDETPPLPSRKPLKLF